MRNIQRRLQALERSAQYQAPRSPVDQIEDVVLKQITDEDLAVMINMAADREAEIDRPITERESEMLMAYDALRETEAKRLGFRSFAEAARTEG